ncbi:hypothetical protein [Haloarchaeobius sp. DFWS5]|uniref:hypothetical protein n=1 Tax=Haloarchaeobius sp. DFWS5 TaxID=3446114 RepID=UPI003EBE8546
MNRAGVFALGCLGFAAVSHLVAVTTESQVAAQTTWLLVSGAVGAAVVALVEYGNGLEDAAEPR